MSRLGFLIKRKRQSLALLLHSDFRDKNTSTHKRSGNADVCVVQNGAVRVAGTKTVCPTAVWGAALPGPQTDYEDPI